MKRDILAIGILFLLCLWSLKILLQPGFYGSHDGAFMYSRTAAMVDELRAGQFPVRISNTLGFGRGYPVFNYHYPLFFYLSSGLVLLGLNVATAIKVMIFLATFWSAFAGYKWLKCFFEDKAAFVGAVLYLLVPYRFLMIFVAGNYGTVLAMAMVSTTLWMISEMVVNQKKNYGWGLSLAVAGLVTAHNVTALIFVPVLGVYTLVLIGVYDRWREMGRLFLSGVLGLGLSAFFWIPALLEMDLVRLSKVIAVDYREHFVTLRQLLYWPWGYGYSNPGVANDGMSFMLGITQWLIVVLAVVLIARNKLRTSDKRLKKTEKLVAVMMGMFLITLFLMLNSSNFIWQSFPLMQQIQFPWRLLAIEIVLVSFLAAYVAHELKHWLILVLIVCLALIVNRNFGRPLTPYLEPEKKYLGDEFLMKGTTDIAWELAPVDVKSAPPLWPDDQGRKFYLPQWEVLVDGRKVETYPDEEGYLSFDEKGEVEYRIVSTPLEKTANAISVLSLFLLLIFPKFGYGQSTKHLH